MTLDIVVASSSLTFIPSFVENKKVTSGTQDTDSRQYGAVDWAGNDDKIEVRVKRTSRSDRRLFYLVFWRFRFSISVHRTAIKIDITCKIL